jgi:phosphoenolpyruvate-protein phosphotransferase (PTS system enzyme I)
MKENNILLNGIAASPGRIYAQSLKIITSNHIILETHISPKKIDSEIQRFLNGLKKTKIELEGIVKKNSEDLHQEFKDILNSQILMLDDPLLINSVKKRIKENLENAPLALFHVIERISGEFMALKNDYFKERADDIRDIGRRVENNLIGKKNDHNILSNLKHPVIIIATELSPSQMVHMDKTNVRGIGTERGGKTGHMAILAKYYEIPCVLGIKNLTQEILEEEYIFLDGDNGCIVRYPNLPQIKMYGPSTTYPRDIPTSETNKACYTLDKERIWIKVNLETENDGNLVNSVGADGVGLFRSEYILLEHPSFDPTEEEQFLIYKKMASDLENKSLVIRTFDIGADKVDHGVKEENPFLGNRGIRFSLRNKEMFRTQIRAILRSSVYGNISILIPMITHLHELLEVKKIINECKIDLQKKNIKFKNPWLGIMVETPACALSLESYVDECDFFSIGTNDLLQYFMAVDRNNSLLSDLYNPFNYGFLTTLRTVIEVGNAHNIPVSICGELASDINFTILLIGLGFREMSVALPLVKKVKKLISLIDLPQAYRLAEEVIKLSKKEKYMEIDAFLFNQHIR